MHSRPGHVRLTGFDARRGEPETALASEARPSRTASREFGFLAIEESHPVPTYTYLCKKCGHHQDVFHSMSAKPRVKCDACGGPCRRLLGTGAGLIFKGSGFYETDYKRSNAKGGDGETSGETSKSESSKKSESSGASSSSKDSGSKPGASSKSDT